MGSVLSLAAVSVFVLAARTETQNHLHRTVDQEVESLVSHFSEDDQVYAVLNAPENRAALPCIFGSSAPCPTAWTPIKAFHTSWDSATGQFQLNPAPSVFDPFDNSVSHGLGTSGLVCQTYGDSYCTIRLRVDWRPLCQNPCVSPRHYQIRISVERANPQALHGIRLAKFERIVTLSLPRAAGTRLALNTKTPCLIRTDGTVVCWGDNGVGLLGRNEVSVSNPVPRPVVLKSNGSVLTNVVDLVDATATICALTAAGQVHCWGENQNAAAGLGSLPASQGGSEAEFYNAAAAPVVSVDGVTPLTGATKLYGGNHSACAKVGNEIQCWGELTEHVTLCQPERTPATHPGAIAVNVPLMIFQLPNVSLYSIPERIRSVAPPCLVPANAEFFRAMANQCWLIGNPGRAMCWGVNYYGMLGARGGGTMTMNNNYFIPRVGLIRANLSAVNPGDELTNVTSIDPGSQRFTCAVLSDTSAVCWGSNSDGNASYTGFMGRGSLALTSEHAPDYVLTGPGTRLLGVRKVDVGWFGACALTTSGQVYCWGSNIFGTVGNGSTAASVAYASLVPLPEPVTEVQVGLNVACALTESGRVFCWGENDRNEMGVNPAGIPYPPGVYRTPVEVGGI